MLAVALILAATTSAIPSARLLPLVAAAVRAFPDAAGPTPSAVRRLLGRDFKAPERQSDPNTEWFSFKSNDGTCVVELGPIVGGKVLKMVVQCELPTRIDAIRLLHEMVSAMDSDWRPPVFFAPEGEIAHTGVIVVRQTPVSAEAYLQRLEDARWRAALVLAVGGRSVVLPPK